MASAGEPTRGTEIAVLEGRRNAEQVRAEGALFGERRAAKARIAMIALYALVSMIRGGPHNWAQTGVGAAYTAFSLITLVIVHAIQTPVPRRTFWIPLVFTTVDYGATVTLGLLDIWWTGALQTGQFAVTGAVLMAFSLARVSLVHVAYSAVLAIAGFVALVGYAGGVVPHTIVFVVCGFAVLGFHLALTNRAVGKMFAGLRQRDNLTRFLPRAVAERVIAQGPRALAPVEREVTVLFSDIRGFTAMSEGLEPRDVLAMLDDYFGRMTQIVKGHDGVIGKFLGDGLLAFWGVPDDAPDHATRAVRAARDMRTALVELNRHRERDGKPAIRIGIGIHTGMVAAGMLGGELQSEYTVIGDAVNVASRVEGLTKDYAVDLLISETTWAQLRDPTGTRIGEGQIRGRKEPVVLYTLDSR